MWRWSQALVEILGRPRWAWGCGCGFLRRAFSSRRWARGSVPSVTVRDAEVGEVGLEGQGAQVQGGERQLQDLHLSGPLERRGLLWGAGGRGVLCVMLGRGGHVCGAPERSVGARCRVPGTGSACLHCRVGGRVDRVVAEGHLAWLKCCGRCSARCTRSSRSPSGRCRF